MRCPSLGHLAGHGRERVRDALNEEVGGSWWNFGESGIIEKLENFEACEGSKGKSRKREKEKNYKKERYFLWLKI